MRKESAMEPERDDLREPAESSDAPLEEGLPVEIVEIDEIGEASDLATASSPEDSADIQGDTTETAAEPEWDAVIDLPFDEGEADLVPGDGDTGFGDGAVDGSGDSTSGIPMPVEVSSPLAFDGSSPSRSNAAPSPTADSSEPRNTQPSGDPSPPEGKQRARLGSDSRQAPAADGGPAMVRPIVMVSLATEQLYAITDRALSTVRDREVKTIEQVADHKIQLAFWEFKCDQRAINRRTR
jgi:hypothetical protein